MAPPDAPIPVQMAYAVPIGNVLMASARKKKSSLRNLPQEEAVIANFDIDDID
jgi:hypothetical protein